MDCLRYKIMPLFNYRNRQSIRLKGFDYSCDGAYFLTICVQNRECLFGEIQKENMILNDYGKIVREIWEDLPTTIVDIDLDEYIIMPNHFHAIIIIDKSVKSTGFYESLNISHEKDRRKMILPKVVGKFKMLTAKAINQMRGTEGKFWQRNYYEIIIRSEEDLHRIREYIINNPMEWDRDENNPSNYNL
jgi:REP element-mobilizing transposase RayT